MFEIHPLLATFVAHTTDNSEQIEVRVHEVLDAPAHNRFQVIALHTDGTTRWTMQPHSTRAMVACFERLAPALQFACEEVRFHLEP